MKLSPGRSARATWQIVSGILPREKTLSEGAVGKNLNIERGTGIQEAIHLWRSTQEAVLYLISGQGDASVLQGAVSLAQEIAAIIADSHRLDETLLDAFCESIP